MAVNALELRPRGAVALFDAALRLCSRSTGVWSITLPAGTALTAATFHLAEAISRHRSLVMPSLLFTLAWLFRAICQGASAHYLERQLLEVEEPSARASFAAALRRAPALVWTAGYSFTLNVCIWLFTAGLGFLLAPSHLVAYAVAMKGRGGLWGLYGTSSKMLGPARHTAALLRLCGALQVLVIINLHAAVWVALMVASKLLAIDVTFIDRFASLDNTVWVAAITAAGFSMFEPLRAASAALLLVDGRVRMEGLDLLAQVEQLPRRHPKKPSATAVASVLLLAALCSLPARAQTTPPPETAEGDDDWSGIYAPGAPEPAAVSTAMSARLRAVIDECELGDEVPASQLEAADRQSSVAAGAMTRFVARVERQAFEEDGCELVASELKAGLKQIVAADRAAGGTDPRAQATEILQRPEFHDDPEVAKSADDGAPKDDEPPGWFSKWWDAFWEKILEWLRTERKTNDNVDLDVPTGPSVGLSNVVVIAAVVALLALLAYLFMRGRGGPQSAGDDEGDQQGLSQTRLEADPMNALTRAPEGWAGLADQLAREGKYREAIRHLYLALLSRLHRDGAIDYDPSKSNWDYFRAFKGSLKALQPFRELTRRFDFAWYGNLEVSSEAYATFRTITQPLLAGAGADAEPQRA